MLIAAPRPLAAALSAGEKELVDRLSGYVSSLTQAEARFEQFNSDGSRSTGWLRVMRPHQARLDYDPPEATMIIARGQRVAVFDRKSNLPPMIYPVNSTPFFHLLAVDVDLGDSRYLSAIEYRDDLIILSLNGADESASGTLRLAFRDSQPPELAGWTFVNSYGTATTLSINTINAQADLSPSLFDIEAEISARSTR